MRPRRGGGGGAQKTINLKTCKCDMHSSVWSAQVLFSKIVFFYINVAQLQNMLDVTKHLTEKIDSYRPNK